jgi:hypothetical protein
VEYFFILFSAINANTITSVTISIKGKDIECVSPNLRKPKYSDNPTTQAQIEDKSMKGSAENSANRRRAKGIKCNPFPHGRSKVGKYVYNA